MAEIVLSFENKKLSIHYFTDQGKTWLGSYNEAEATDGALS
ncbi:hypothetical protein CCACVL1_08659 [Corchorus capsularis]|uniref:Uncharacterized protein n=1 Tax=Corchorus capsularis TaxID=210143 RepID=A0A1R3IZA6_COCAP|nr:hypothetical protein CCACVL1_08659 [Corchorus capsularis]